MRKIYMLEQIKWDKDYKTFNTFCINKIRQEKVYNNFLNILYKIKLDKCGKTYSDRDKNVDLKGFG